eukprot:3810440-Alexandrium_andersonii.AAC.1
MLLSTVGKIATSSSCFLSAHRCHVAPSANRNKLLWAIAQIGVIATAAHQAAALCGRSGATPQTGSIVELADM